MRIEDQRLLEFSKRCHDRCADSGRSTVNFPIDDFKDLIALAEKGAKPLIPVDPTIVTEK